MKVLYSCLSKSLGGLELSVIKEALQLQNQNIPVEILCLPGSKINQKAKKEGLNCLTLKADRYFHPFGIIKLAKIIKRNSYNIIHTHLSKDLWKLVPALKYAGSNIPLILTKQMGSGVSKKDFLHKWLYKRVTYILAISNHIQENILKTCPVDEDKIILHHNSVDLKIFDPSNAQRDKIRKEFEIKDDELVIGMLARISRGKGHEEFLYAAKKINDEYQDVKFLIAGNSNPDDKDYENKIISILKNYNLRNKVIFTGFREDTPDLISAMDIFAFPSHSESFGIGLIEAMAMEKPSVSTNSHGILDITVDGVTGYLFERKNGDDLYRKLKLLIDSPEKRKSFGIAGRKRVIEKFNIEKQSGKLFSLYEQLIL
jgi:glycosyltransferase involved in cell wall biosynthesis